MLIACYSVLGAQFEDKGEGGTTTLFKNIWKGSEDGDSGKIVNARVWPRAPPYLPLEVSNSGKKVLQVGTGKG